MVGTVLGRAAEPFLKWAGGKRLLLDRIGPMLPAVPEKATYFEPFVGGGAVFFHLGPKRAVLADINTELVETYRAVHDEVEMVIEALRRLPWTEEDYYRIRASSPRTVHTRAARFIYLNKTCFNGLYRVNLKGEFNVPFGWHNENLVVCDAEQLRRASKALRRAHPRFQSSDFEDVLARATAGDVAYLDPPYTISHSNNGFIEYNARVFAWEDQRRLAAVAKRLVKDGVQVVISNAEHHSIRELYPESIFAIHEIERWSTMAAAKTKRFQTVELLIVGRNGSGRGGGA